MVQHPFLSLKVLAILLGEMERIQDQNPNAEVLYDIERGRIEITYPLPRDLITFHDGYKTLTPN